MPGGSVHAAAAAGAVLRPLQPVLRWLLLRLAGLAGLRPAFGAAVPALERPAARPLVCAVHDAPIRKSHAADGGAGLHAAHAGGAQGPPGVAAVQACSTTEQWRGTAAQGQPVARAPVCGHPPGTGVRRRAPVLAPAQTGAHPPGRTAARRADGTALRKAVRRAAWRLALNRWPKTALIAAGLASGLVLYTAPTTAVAASGRAGPASTPCPGPALVWQPLEAGLWWLPAAPGDATPGNRGQVSNLLLAQDGARVWLMGSGPSPAFGRALACSVRQQLGLKLTDLVSPWPRPEAVLGASGLGPVRHWGHAEVARALQQRCAHCVQRLRLRLGDAQADLGPDPVRLPTRLLHGPQGRLGPWRWWLLSRGDGYPVTVWQHRAHGLVFAPGLLWGDGAPDGRDADIGTLARATHTLLSLPGAAPTAPPAWLGEQGPLLPPDAAARQARYWVALQAAVAAALEQGEADDAATAPAGAADAGLAPDDLRHALNRQRAWRQAEEAWLQRSLR